ncbi:MAG: glycosyl hydrolase family 28-related protein, partial [bacterium]
MKFLKFYDNWSYLITSGANLLYKSRSGTTALTADTLGGLTVTRFNAADMLASDTVSAAYLIGNGAGITSISFSGIPNLQDSLTAKLNRPEATTLFALKLNYSDTTSLLGMRWQFAGYYARGDTGSVLASKSFLTNQYAPLGHTQAISTITGQADTNAAKQNRGENYAIGAATGSSLTPSGTSGQFGWWKRNATVPQSGTVSLATATDTLSAADLIIKGPVIDVRAYGAKGDGTTDDVVAIQNAINSLTNGGIVFFPSGKYRISQALTGNLPHTVTDSICYSYKVWGIWLRGAGIYETEIFNSGIGNAITLDGDTIEVYDFKITDMAVVGSALSGYGVYLNKAHHVLLDRVAIAKHGKHGLYLTNSWGNTFRNNSFSYNGLAGSYDGINLTGASHFNVFTTCSVGKNTRYGVFLGTTPNGVSFFGLEAGENGNSGMFVGGSAGLSVIGGYFEKNGGTSQLNIDGECDGGTVSGIYFNGGGVSLRGMILSYGVGMNISGNSFSGHTTSSIATSYAGSNCQIGPNQSADATFLEGPIINHHFISANQFGYFTRNATIPQSGTVSLATATDTLLAAYFSGNGSLLTNLPSDPLKISYTDTTSLLGMRWQFAGYYARGDTGSILASKGFVSNQYVADTITISAGAGLSGGGNLNANRTISADTANVLGSKSFIGNEYVPKTRTLTAGAGLSGGGTMYADRTISADTASILASKSFLTNQYSPLGHIQAISTVPGAQDSLTAKLNRTEFLIARMLYLQDSLTAKQNRGENYVIGAATGSSLTPSGTSGQFGWFKRNATAPQSGTVGLATATDTVLVSYLGVGTVPIDKFEVAGAIHTSGSAANFRPNGSGYLDYISGEVRIAAIGADSTTRAGFRIDIYEGDAGNQLTPLQIQNDGNVIFPGFVDHQGTNSATVTAGAGDSVQVSVSGVTATSQIVATYAATTDSTDIPTGIRNRQTGMFTIGA